MSTQNIGQGEPENDPQPEQLKAAEIEAALDLVDGELSERMVMGETERTTVTLWIGHTYIYHHFKHTPRLLVTSAGPEMGKSELMKLIAAFSNGGEKIDGATPSALVRIKQYSPEITLCLDQLDPMGSVNSNREKDSELMNLLCSSTEVGARMLMSERGEAGSGRQWTPQSFEFGIPTALGKIGVLPSEALMSRAMIVRMLPETQAERNARMEYRLTPLPKTKVRTDLSTALKPLRPVYTRAPNGVPSRMEDIWQPSLAIARASGERWAKRAEAALKEMAFTLERQEPRSFTLLRQAANSVMSLAHPTISRADLWKRLGGWDGLRMSDGQMRDHLSAAGLKIRPVKYHGKTVRGYTVRGIQKAAARLQEVTPSDGLVTPETPMVTAVTPVTGMWG